MASDAEWSLDFCLSCDKQSTEGPYCSQACRLSDLERSGSPHPHSAASSPSSSYGQPGFHLPPAVDFQNYKLPSSSSTSSSKTHTPAAKNASLSSIDTSYFDHQASAPRRDSATTTTAPSSPASALPRGTRLELQQYEDAFDYGRHRRHQQFRQS